MKVLPEVHIVDRYFKAVESLGIINDGKGLDYFIPAAEEILMETLPVTHQQGYIAVVIGGKHNTKIFPASKVAEVCKRLALPVILLGGKEDRERGEKIAGEAGTMTYNSCGIFSLNQSASLIRQAVAVMTNDTGLMHIAAAFKKPVVSLWGNTIPGFGMYPYFPVNAGAKSMVAEVTGLSCRPCSKIGFSECPKKHFKCMNDISIEPVVEFLDAEFENRKS
jgi:ADP-heptose:LPS heptosyltransferase